ncbi:hypothetical protein [Labrys wisconsinensis]|uniref:Drug/metabolite transporter (DMT)-like permease n=1 Tax=Labrys wisconsinensis TaxID=425677 RepID=A0ABU0JHR4_9HYPH|nr:hypothetical protein [Labrys wisconsinensis]MDQ0473825.1 drug/metabolite transporter (DMT)-like permease [Labrys wisconsinensis]
MTRFIVRLLIVPIGIGFAALAALVCAIVGTVASGLAGNFASIAAFTGLTVLAAALTGADPDDIAAFLGLVWLVMLGVLFVPIGLMALIGELFGIAAWAAYAFGTGALFALVPVLFPGDPATHGWPAQATLGFFATGIIAGTVYWMIAGHGAGRNAANRLPPP